jgi:hypothetical protein
MTNVVPIGKAKKKPAGPTIPEGHVTEDTTIGCPDCGSVFFTLTQHEGPVGEAGKFSIECAQCPEEVFTMKFEADLELPECQDEQD